MLFRPNSRLLSFIQAFIPIVLATLMTISTASASTLLVMGDSLSAAYNLRQDQGWVSLLQAHLSETYSDIDVVNASVSGETTQGGLARFQQLLTEHQPCWVILELGANDALRGYPLTLTKQNLENMVKQSQQASAKVLLIGNQIPLNYGKRYTDLFYGLYNKIATEYQTAYMPFMLEDVALNKALMLSDGLHPNEDGQVIILANILPYLIPILD